MLEQAAHMLARLARAGPALLARRPLALRALPTAKVAAIGISTFVAYSASPALCMPVAEHDDIDAAIAECINDALSPRAQRARDREQREHEDNDDIATVSTRAPTRNFEVAVHSMCARRR